MKMNRFPARKESPVLDTARMRSWLARRRYNIQYTICNIQYTIYNIQYTIYNIQYTIYNIQYDSLSDVGEIRVYQRADFQSGSRVLKKVF